MAPNHIKTINMACLLDWNALVGTDNSFKHAPAPLSLSYYSESQRVFVSSHSRRQKNGSSENRNLLSLCLRQGCACTKGVQVVLNFDCNRGSVDAQGARRATFFNYFCILPLFLAWILPLGWVSGRVGGMGRLWMIGLHGLAVFWLGI